MNPLVHQHCQTSAPLLSAADIHTLSLLVPAWKTDAGVLVRTFDFADYAATMAFAGAIGWLAVRENHHPDLGIHFNRVVVHYCTHDAGGLTRNDFVCAAKLDLLYLL
ncbi:4a-hydroxytetrahydrobiopterin dehydratase [Laribacter hongkongensis]|uniref:4a-hydroxytetrahydrobiopterin dehydratase n=1 Tax=Laribacter hongkongensis TaxID=168471 RepID=UPI001EFE75A6|nr:4a-hydroxytetrahydrobiopterin dehydratase [Laribacter hongkongensis]MCG9057404.1 4a-hydroxytetrahydrobiopterin dehydratase [Laribacter hongkongensis]MCG9084720.1 4a-hydroxytetrahydrobiopterin dehydratase [Laribacter hongkongensis]